jgi:hypothetical protein
MSEQTIAQKLNGKKEKEVKVEGVVNYDAMSAIYTFEDGSKGYLLTISEPCEPYIAASQSTMHLRPVKYWRVKE